MVTVWQVNGGQVTDLGAALGLIPSFIFADDERPFAEQVEERYAHGGGWHVLEGFSFDKTTGKIHFPGDQPLAPLAFTSSPVEMFIIYRYGFCCIYNKEHGTHEVARLD